MSETLLSVGLDVGTTSTQMIVSELEIENQASSFAVPDMQIIRRKILHRGKVHFTPLLGQDQVDGPGVRAIMEEEYRQAGIRRADVDTGAIIITGETSRKENARAVLDAMADCAGEFVVATAGPELESILAAKGAGADGYSGETGQTVLHMDIGGGTSNLALIRDGKIVKTGCLNVGGRLLKFEGNGKVSYVSPVLAALCTLKAGDTATLAQVKAVTDWLVQALEMAAGLRQATPLLEQLWTRECGPVWTEFPKQAVLSFSGGVADCIDREVPWLEYGDMGPVLGNAIRYSRLCEGQYRLGTETIRATVIGAGCHSAQLSGSTVFCQNVSLPLKNLPVVTPEAGNRDGMRSALQKQEGLAVIALPGMTAPGYAQVKNLAEEIAASVRDDCAVVCLEQDMAKALGQALALRLGANAKILCIDRIKLTGESYLDVGAPVGPAFPVVVKTLVLGR